MAASSANSAVAMQLEEVRKCQLQVIEGVRSLRVARQLDAFPGRPLRRVLGLERDRRAGCSWQRACSAVAGHAAVQP